MRSVFGLVLIVGMGLAGFAVYMVKGYVGDQQLALKREQAKAAQIVETVEVMAVNRAIAYGEELDRESIIPIKYAKAFLPEGAFGTIDEVFSEGEQTRIVLRAMEPNEPILAVKVTEPGEDAGINQRLLPGMRAFTIKVDASSGVSGFLRPGDRVDIYWTGSLRGLGDGSGGPGVTKLIQTGVELIAIDQNSDESRTENLVARTVTVQASPEAVAGLAQAQATGNLSLSLVGMGDETVIGQIEVNQRSLLGIIEEEAPIEQEVVEAPVEKVCTIKTRRGADVVEIPIPCTN